MKILAVCGFGCGSSMILKLSLEKVLSDLNIKAEVENTDLIGARTIDCNMIFTSEEFKQELDKEVDVPIYTVVRYMDVEEIKSKMKEILNI
ncbi:PTS sugar transporter subunit IIB [Oceanivirga salmonicida]|uniref:PTS sugar transporter subunit IIB n=1 Tax=Oceanivirga salmonicida TaxID=1769291 RepID=UPI00082D0627|nr:PTS sugar transporter subunit IIB [Oceanivirga salmonicida]